MMRTNYCARNKHSNTQEDPFAPTPNAPVLLNPLQVIRMLNLKIPAASVEVPPALFSAVTSNSPELLMIVPATAL